jgi:anti-sigma B factor antagonist
MAVSTGPAGLEVVTSRRGDAHVVALRGELELATIGRAEAELGPIEAGECDEIVVDLSGLEFLDSTGIHFLIALRERCAARGRQLSLVAPSGSVRRVLDLSGAAAILTSVEAAA